MPVLPTVLIPRLEPCQYYQQYSYQDWSHASITNSTDTKLGAMPVLPTVLIPRLEPCQYYQHSDTKVRAMTVFLTILNPRLEP
ncbi:hypothetical protein RRG08_026694 [Elysia crispata]|uniref:Uncharacterized protein n=1 Tax=Elysia crispata TaxID=231223 RepID=A0AAE1E6Q5_9GAST|nr:hypothetical protein RRG08_026694 [Elysia crispata]